MRVWDRDVGRMGWERKTRVTQQQQAEGVRSPDKIKGSKIEVQVVLSSQLSIAFAYPRTTLFPQKG